MKVIDQTPYYKESGELSLVDRGRAMMQFGPAWFKEIEAQKSVINVIEKILDKNYTLLRNIIPPGLDARIPFILVGPPGVFVMYVTPLTGMFRAKVDQWGTISGSVFKPEKPNLLTRTEHMARAIQIYLQRQGYAELTIVEAILLCADPTVHVDSLRPIIRVIMRDALERFAISLTQARVVLSPESVHDVVNRLLTPPKPAQPAQAAPVPNSPAAEDPYVPAFALPGAEPPAVPVESVNPFNTAAPEAQPGRPAQQRVRRRGGLSCKQSTLLIIMFLIWLIIVVAFFLVAVLPSILSLLS